MGEVAGSHPRGAAGAVDKADVAPPDHSQPVRSLTRELWQKMRQSLMKVCMIMGCCILGSLAA